MMLLSIENLSSREVAEAAPWEFNQTEPPFPDKQTREKWRVSSSTKHCFFSGVEGLNARLRVSSENPAYRIRALVVDYDVPVTDERFSDILTHLTPEVSPYAIGRTSSGGVRAVWLLEEPCFAYSKEVFSRLILGLARAVGAPSLFAGLDEPALKNSAQYYEAGRAWQVLGQSGEKWGMIRREVVLLALDKALKKARKLGDGVVLPLDVIAAEVESRWPGRWQGEFIDGARGARFWDPAGDALSAIVRRDGMVCFTGDKPFLSWGEIFGHSFVSTTLANRIGGTVLDTYFDGKTYWRRLDGEMWRGLTRMDMALHLKGDGLSANTQKGDTSSEVEKALTSIQTTGWIAGAAPFVYLPKGVCKIMNEQYLNISNTEVLSPVTVTEKVAWGQGFPWLSDFLEGLFDEESDPYFMSWLARFYSGAYHRKPSSGQIVFLAGDADQGKTLLSNNILSRLMGGHMDASHFLLGETTFNSQLFEKGLWTLDDALPASDPRRKKLYSAMLKKMAANKIFEYHPKFKNPVMVPWCGRVLVTCNRDAESVQILPDLDITIMDKVSVFSICTLDRDFIDGGRTLSDTIERELPWFASWLLQYEPPQEVIGSFRYGIKSFHEKELKENADNSSMDNTVEELIESFLAGWSQINGDVDIWHGRATDLHMAMANDETVKNSFSRIDVVRLGRILTKMVAKSKIAKRKSNGKLLYSIPIHPESHFGNGKLPPDLDDNPF